MQERIWEMESRVAQCEATLNRIEAMLRGAARGNPQQTHIKPLDYIRSTWPGCGRRAEELWRSRIRGLVRRGKIESLPDGTISIQEADKALHIKR